MNNISKLQNEKKILDLLYSQKKYYKKSENQKYLKWIITICIFLIGNNVFIKNMIGDKVVIIGVGIGTLILLCIENKINEFIKIASATQELIDRILFGLDKKDYNFNGITVSEVNSLKDKIIKNNRKNYLVVVNSDGKDKPKGVKNWYDIESKIPLKKAIIECQKQNIYWDDKLIKAYEHLLTGMLSLLVILIVISVKEKSVEDVSLLVLTLSPLIREVVVDIININNTQQINSSIRTAIDTIERNKYINYSEIKIIQSKIYNRRQCGFQIPDIIHTIFLKIM